MAEGLDLASRSVGHKETSPTAQDQFSAQAEKEPEEEKDEDDGEEVRYQEERKRKGKALMKKKPSVKRQRTANTSVVTTEAVQRTPPSRREQSDSEYAISEESDSDSDISLENEECSEQQLPRDHRELVHSPVERLRYRRWSVDLTDDLVEEMKLFDSKKLQKVFDGKDEGSKQVKSGKVLHIPSLDELRAREQFLSYLHALGFEWLLENGNPNISVRLAKEFFTTFRFRVTTDLDEVSISFQLFGGEISMNLIEWTVRLGMCSLEEAIG
ncbi:uncharacterized protein LOC121762102 [Salvia splendens]|uniref:uncharacterized protein LOC121762102 n=1 Tax=Salvia splendens TaxID=180675 RepID=UPI001C25AA39|nr:uncharacterized protein LOC121762102 [Salvia splendens]XP_042013805.1 uncharacterized protein LOC121762102 [Salvia splendens]